MAWLMEKNWHFFEPNFEITENPDNTKLINATGISSFLPWRFGGKPIVARQSKAHKGKLSDMILVDGSVAVHQRFRDLVEELEPGIHAFAPIILERKNGDRIGEDYFLFSAQQDIDCLITDNNPENFEFLWENDTGVKQILCKLTQPGHEVPISKPPIAGKHLWTAGLLGLNQMFVSVEFADAARENLRGLRRFERRCTAIDRPWIAEEQMGPLLSRHNAYVTSGRSEVNYTLGEIW
ncbi:MAG: hypothetical protein U0S50_05745 [Sphingopyxis sp.]|uniref:imm11 family protein n=1 Tax=Sphingopyxis sp. TaxID=1908224 RepID=UPI002AB8C9D5|nr:DUF1629 domain-containing protein [Sphingopyxis sp.]MDZ3831307.1 hypothetical protein [Sphingopyxis sp.]